MTRIVVHPPASAVARRRVGLVALLALMLFPSLSLCRASAPSSERQETVMLVHGLARTPRCMARLAASLTREGYAVHILDYPTTRKPIAALCEEHLAPAIAAVTAAGTNRLHFVTHSLGGIVLRHYLATHDLPQLGRIVMLGPPNKGSEVIDRIGHTASFKWLNGPAGQQLGTASNSVPNTLPVPDATIGIIAGRRSINWILSSYIPGPDDGKVSPERTKLDGMTDFIIIPAAHPFLMRDREAIALSLRFLKTARFRPEEP